MVVILKLEEISTVVSIYKKERIEAGREGGS